MESLLNTDDHGKDLASVQNLMKKHQLIEADIMSHEDRIKDMNEQVGSNVFFCLIDDFFQKFLSSFKAIWFQTYFDHYRF